MTFRKKPNLGSELFWMVPKEAIFNLKIEKQPWFTFWEDFVVEQSPPWKKYYIIYEGPLVITNPLIDSYFCYVMLLCKCAQCTIIINQAYNACCCLVRPLKLNNLLTLYRCSFFLNFIMTKKITHAWWVLRFYPLIKNSL